MLRLFLLRQQPRGTRGTRRMAWLPRGKQTPSRRGLGTGRDVAGGGGRLGILSASASAQGRSALQKTKASDGVTLRVTLRLLLTINVKKDHRAITLNHTGALATRRGGRGGGQASVPGAVWAPPRGRGPQPSPGQVQRFTVVLKLERAKMNERMSE